MTKVPIPNWNSHGVIPPINTDSPVSRDRSPYKASVLDFAMRFSTSPERIAILKGFLNHRSKLHEIGVSRGFQWLDGSFLEQIEMIEQRNPKDLDVVTFFYNPAMPELLLENGEIFDNKKVQEEYKIDSYFVELDLLSKEQLIQHSHYWYSVWSHRRNAQWKGFIQIDLSSSEDLAAMAHLGSLFVPGDQR